MYTDFVHPHLQANYHPVERKKIFQGDLKVYVSWGLSGGGEGRAMGNEGIRVFSLV